MTIDENILVHYIDNSLSAEETAEVEAWLSASAENRKMLEQIYFTLQLTERLKVMRSVDTDKAYAQFRKNKKTDKQKEKLGLSTFRLVLQRIAAILIIPLLLLAGYMLLRDEGGREELVEKITNPGVVAVFNLPDGSRVWLNGGSSLTYATDFGRRDRRVELTGESYFEVAKDATRPFIVSVGPEYQVRVVGTSFNVSAYAEDTVIETTLVEGLVKIEHVAENGENAICQLHPNERAAYQKNKKNLEVKEVNTESYIAWIDGEIIFRQEPMEKVLKTLERHYNVRFEVKDPEIMNALINARFKEEELTQVMEYLKVASEIQFRFKPQAEENEEKQIPIIEIYR